MVKLYMYCWAGGFIEGSGNMNAQIDLGMDVKLGGENMDLADFARMDVG